MLIGMQIMTNNRGVTISKYGSHTIFPNTFRVYILKISPAFPTSGNKSKTNCALYGKCPATNLGTIRIANPQIMAKRSFLDKVDINITTAAKPMIPINVYRYS